MARPKGSGWKPLCYRLTEKTEIVPSGCWLWTGCRHRLGYGKVGSGGRNLLAHRLYYEMFKGPIPEGYDLDHLCRNPSCVNPEHLEPVTHGENLRRGKHATKTHCKNGHPFDEDNTHVPARNPHKRECRACWRERAARQRAKKMQVVA
jgi:hypothetical protein